jgi:hypothetical protein
VACPTTSEAAPGDPTTSTGTAVGAPSSLPQMVSATASMGVDDNAVEEPKVIMGHPSLGVPRAVSLFEAMGTTHFALNHPHDVLCREREDINEERLCLSTWVSMLKKQTTSKKEKVEARQKRLDMMKILFTKRHAVVDKLDAQAQKPLNDTKELYAIAEARASATIKKQEDLNA